MALMFGLGGVTRAQTSGSADVFPTQVASVTGYPYGAVNLPTTVPEYDQYAVLGSDYCFNAPAMGPPSLEDVAMLVQWDVTMANLQLYGVPHNAVITQARIMAPPSSCSTFVSSDLVVTVAAVSAAWNWNTITWDNFQTSEAPLTFNLGTTGFATKDFDITTLFQSWLSGVNHGAVLIPSGQQWWSAGLRWGTHLNPSQFSRPLLRLDYTVNGGGCTYTYEDDYPPLDEAPFGESDGTPYFNYSICPAGDQDWRIFNKPGIAGNWNCTIETAPGPNGGAFDQLTIVAYEYPPPPESGAILKAQSSGIYPKLKVENISDGALYVGVTSSQEVKDYTLSATGAGAEPLPLVQASWPAQAELVKGQPVALGGSLANAGGLADHGGVSISVQGLSCLDVLWGGIPPVLSGSLASGGAALYWPPAGLWSKKGSLEPAEYVLAEGVLNPWPSFQAHDMTIMFTPMRTGKYLGRVRGWLTSNGWGTTATDPATPDVGCVGEAADQQEYCTETSEFHVLPDLPGGTTVIIHGLQPSNSDCSSPTWWPITMATAISTRTGGSVWKYDPDSGQWDYVTGDGGPSEEIVLVFDWCTESNNIAWGSNYTEAAGDALFASLRNAEFVGALPAGGFAAVDPLASSRALHIIGHSRGAVVLSKAWRRIIEFVPEKGVDHVTMLDPHPADGEFNPIDDQPLLWEDAFAKAENYWQMSSVYPQGQPIDGAVNCDLSSLFNAGLYEPHVAVHQWYHGTIDVFASSDGKIDREHWYTWCDGQASGYYLSRGGGGWDAPAPSGCPVSGQATPAESEPIDNLFFNGDFEANESGWVGHGGGGAGDITFGSSNNQLKLGGLAGLSKTHNRLYIPVNAVYVQFDLTVNQPGTNDELAVRVGAGPAPLDSPVPISASSGGPVTHQVALGSWGGSSQTITFELRDALQAAVQAEVHVDNIRFVLTWKDEGQALAGVAGDPHLVGTGTLEPGSSGSLSLDQAAPNALALLFVSTNSAPAAFKGGVLVPVPPILQVVVVTSAAGNMVLSWNQYPAGMTSGADLYFQYAISDAAAPKGVALSNAVHAKHP